MDHYDHLSELAEKHGFAAHDSSLVAEMTRIVSAANAEIGWQPGSGANANQRPEELPLVAFPRTRPVDDVPVLVVPVTLDGAARSRGRPALFYIDDISPNHPRFQRSLKPWGLLDDWRWRLQMWALATALRLLPRFRRALPILSPSAADLFGVGAETTPFQPGGTTGEARLMALFGLQRQPDRALPALGRHLQRRIRKGVATGGFGTVLRNRAVAFLHEEMRVLLRLYERERPITMLAIGPYDGRHHELAAIRGVCEQLDAADGQRFRRHIRAGFAEPDRVGLQIARAISRKHGIELFDVPGLDLAHPEQSGLRELVAAERSLWRARAPEAGDAHVRVVFVGSAGEYRWGNIERLLRGCHAAGVDSIHGSFMKDTRFLRMAVELSRKDWLIHGSERDIVDMLRSVGYEADYLFSQKRNPVVNVSASRAAPETPSAY
jgi:hypothetical protein